MQQLQKKLDHVFGDIKLLKRALTHSSYANEKSCKSNERLEFLGDSVLSLITSEYLFSHYRNFPEGELTKLRAALVCERSLCSFAKSLSLGDHLFIGKGEIAAGARERPSTLADAFEAVLAAVYIDGGLSAARRLVLPYIENAAENAEKGDIFKDYKTILQEIVQQKPGQLLEYALAGEEGPDHDKRFFSKAVLNGDVLGEGKGRSKKEAEQNAARAALNILSAAQKDGV